MIRILQGFVANRWDGHCTEVNLAIYGGSFG